MGNTVPGDVLVGVNRTERVEQLSQEERQADRRRHKQMHVANDAVAISGDPDIDNYFVSEINGLTRTRKEVRIRSRGIGVHPSAEVWKPFRGAGSGLSVLVHVDQDSEIRCAQAVILYGDTEA